MNIQVDPTSSNLASAMLNSKIRPRVVVGYGVKIFHPSPPNYVTRSPGLKSKRRYVSRDVSAKTLVMFDLKKYVELVARSQNAILTCPGEFT